MANFTGHQGAFTPSTSVDNFVLDANTAGGVGKVKMIEWGGRGTTSTGYRTRWARPTTNASSTFTAITAQSSNPLATAVNRFGTFATSATLGTDPANNLFAQDWNVLGGGGVIVLPIGGEWLVVNSSTAGHQQIACRNVAGVDASLSSYGTQWEE
jgi:hypothetical protein